MSIEMTASLFCSYANEEKPGTAGKSTKRRRRLWHGRRLSTRGWMWVCCGEGSLPRSPHRALSYFKDTRAQGILLVELCERDSENIGGKVDG